MRPILITILIVAVGFGLFWALKPQAPSDIPSATVSTSTAATTTPSATATTSRQATLASFTFTGYGPGKTEVGTFKDFAVSGVTFNGAGEPTTGKFVIKTASVSTGKDGLDKHLCNEDFFNCPANPEIVFDLKSVTAEAVTNGIPPAGSTLYTVSGDLTFNGVTKNFSFPVTAQNSGTFLADFKFDTTFFNFKYTAIDKEVRIQFEGTVR